MLFLELPRLGDRGRVYTFHFVKSVDATLFRLWQLGCRSDILLN
jgi:hypothetical protein